jgi:hypothetical protein
MPDRAGWPKIIAGIPSAVEGRGRAARTSTWRQLMISVVYVMQRRSNAFIHDLRRERCLPCRLPVRIGAL